jgi:hypothetical protein
MVVELSALLTAVGAVSSLMKEMMPIVQTIRPGFMARNKKTQEKLMKSLKELQQNLQHAGELAQRTEEYLRTHENILELQWLCRRAESFLKDNLDDCRSRTSANYAGNWNVLDTMFQTIGASRDAPQKVVMDLGEWYDEKDKNQIGLLLQQFTSAYDRAAAHVKHHVASDLLYELHSITSSLQDAEIVLRNTIYNRILKALKTLGQ